MYNGIKRVLKKLGDDQKLIEVIDEFTQSITGGASLHEILMITKDEALSPTLASELTVDDSCKFEN